MRTISVFVSIRSVLMVGVASLFFLLTATGYCETVFFREVIGQASIGYDAKAGETIVACYSLGVIGPDNIDSAVNDLVHQAVDRSFKACMVAFAATPGEISVRLLAAFETFKDSIGREFSSQQLLQGLADKIHLGVFQTTERINGLQIVVNVENPLAKTYQDLCSKVGGDMGKVMQLNAILAMPDGVNVSTGPYKLPPDIDRMLASIPDQETLDRLSKSLGENLKNGERISDAAMKAASDAIGLTFREMGAGRAEHAVFDGISSGGEEAQKFAHAAMRETQRAIDDANRNISELNNRLKRFTDDRLADLEQNSANLAAEQLNQARAQLLTKLAFVATNVRSCAESMSRQEEQAISEVRRFAVQIGLPESSPLFQDANRALNQAKDTSEKVVTSVVNIQVDLAKRAVGALGQTTQQAADFVNNLNGFAKIGAPIIPPIPIRVDLPNVSVSVPQIPQFNLPRFPNWRL